ncbi:MAG: hypothetical protein IBJ11_06155 [Phycisphaerales bacterium]|nr:hypothetical protein [Phycisphaerales bacterium]
MRARALTTAAIALTPLLSGCAASGEGPALSFPAGEYPVYFQAAKDVLRDARFDLARIDAQSGIVQTDPRASSGFATPWIPHSATFADSVEGVAQRQRRIATIAFSPPTSPPTAGQAPSAPGPTDPNTPMTLSVSVMIQRTYRPGRRVDPTSIRLSSFTVDTLSEQAGEPRQFSSDLRPDPALAASLAAKIRDRAREISGK